MKSRLMLLAGAMLLAASSASADPIIYTVTAKISPAQDYWSGVYSGIDGGGYFGPAGASLIGDIATITWTAIDCECIGAGNYPIMASLYPLPDPILDVTLTINDHTYDFGPANWYGIFEFNPIDGQRANYLYTGNFIYTEGPVVSGEFEIANDPNFTSLMTGGVFEPVPLPIAGTGLPGLFFGTIGLFGWWRKKRAIWQ